MPDKGEVNMIEVGWLSEGDAREIANWIAYQLTHAGYVPAIMIEVYEAIVKELKLDKEGA